MDTKLDMQIAMGMMAGIGLMFERYEVSEKSPGPEMFTREQCQMFMVGSWMTGAYGSANALVRHDGELTPQQIERSLAIVAREFGMNLEDFKKPKEDPDALG